MVMHSYRGPVDAALSEKEHEESHFQSSDDETVRPLPTRHAMRGLPDGQLVASTSGDEIARTWDSAVEAGTR